MRSPRRFPAVLPARSCCSRAVSCAVAFLACIAIFTPIASARGRTETFRFHRDRLAFGKTGSYDVVRCEGLDLTAEVGTPQLPVMIAHIPLPPGMDIGQVRVVRTESETIEGRFDLLPVQPPQPLSRPLAAFVGGDGAVYASTDLFPREVAAAAGEGFAAGYNIGAIAVHPLRYVPSEKRLVFHSLVEVEIAYAPSARRPAPFRPTAYAEAIHRRPLERLVASPEGLTRFTESARSSASLLPPENHPYVIVTNSEFAPEFESLARWKTMRGLSAAVVTTETIDATYSGVDLAEKIREFIKDAYANWGTVWVLLGGDTDFVPARIVFAMASGYGGINDEIRCDLYYADLDGDWNANGNSIYGEVADNIDMYPDVFVGRASVDSPVEARDWARKVEIYENWSKRPPGPWHELEMLFLAEILWTNPYTDSGEGKNYIDEMFVPPRYDPILKLYESLGNELYTLVIEAMNAGQNIINHNGHAWLNSMGIGTGSLYLTAMDGLTNEYRPSILYSIGCWPAAIDFDCIAEHFITCPTGGGVAFIGNSRYGWGSPGNPTFGYSDRFDQQFFRQLFVEDVHRIGQTLAAAKSCYVPFARQENVYRWCEFEINLLGDPEMAVWTDTAQPIDVAHPQWVPVGESRLPITVTRTSDGSPVEGALVCAMKGEEIYETGLTGPDGRVDFRIAPVTPTDDLCVTVTGHNVRVFTRPVAVNSGLPWVHVSSYETNGSREGYVYPGATVSVTACFKNYGDQAATRLSAVLHGSLSAIMMIDSTESIGTIAPGDSVVVAGAFVFSAAPGLKNGDVFNLPCDVTDDMPMTWTRDISVTCATPVLVCDHHALADAGGGDGDGFAEPGETVSLNLRLANTGLAAGHGVIATVGTSSPYISTPPGVPLDFGSLEPDERRTARCEVEISPSCPEPSFHVVRVGIATGDGFSFPDSVVVVVGRSGLQDDMENGEGGWGHRGIPDFWHLSTYRAHSGAASWYCGWDPAHQYVGGARDTLQAPSFIVGENHELSFWCWYHCATYGVDGVYVDVNGGSGWKVLDFLGSGGALGTPGVLGIGNDWLEYRYDLSGYSAGTAVGLRFRFVSDTDGQIGEGVYIDDVTVGPKASSVVVGIDPPLSDVVGDVLYQNHPNPFNPATAIRFHLSSSQRTRIEIFDVRGSRVRVLMDRVAGPGPGEVTWDGKDERGKAVATGIYFYRMMAGGFAETRKIAVLR